MALPTRIITCAWGERYIEELLSLTLPALLAPGNLPYVASVVACELVILTEHAAFSRVLSDVTVRKIRELCSVRLIEVDDLIPSPDQYGMAITYALHRGFSDLGESAADSWLLFLNADFIPADGSLRRAIWHLARGERLVAAPSYCVRAESVTPVLLQRVDPHSRALAISPREMAALVLRHRHDTIVGKTVNQATISIRYMDQFYWLVDPTTLLGHQMPVAIVGMRPERNLPEPNSFWDYGLIREFCPSSEHCVLGDSDEFLMLELRRTHVAEDWMVPGFPEPGEIARNMISFVTSYTKDMVRHPLTLHAAELPDGVDEARAKLRAFVDSVLVHLPEVLPSHLEHPQFEYHWPSFMEGRHRYLSAQLGPATETEEPPSSLSELDRAWWKLDGLIKTHSRRRAHLTDLMNRQRDVIATLQARLQDAALSRRIEADERLQRELEAMTPRQSKEPTELTRTVHLQPGTAMSPGGDPATTWIEPVLDDAERWSHLVTEAEERQTFLARAENFVNTHYRERLLMLDLEFESARAGRQLDYERLLKRRTRSAAIPHVITSSGPRAPATTSDENDGLGMVRRLYRLCFGSLPRVGVLHPYWAAMRHLVRLVDTAAENGAANVLAVGGGRGVADGVADRLPGLHARVSPSDLLEGNFGKAFRQSITFDLCICSLGDSELRRFRELADTVAPYMSRGGTIVGFYPNFSVRPLSDEEIAGLEAMLDGSWSGRLHCAGSERSARVVRRFHATVSRGSGWGLVNLVRGAMMLLSTTLFALVANRSEAAAREEQPSRVLQHCTSLTIELRANLEKDLALH